jgi:hypothetical protein
MMTFARWRLQQHVTHRRALLLIVGVGLVHRLLLFWRYFPDLTALIAQNPNDLTWQYLTIPALTEHLGRSLLYLQQSPPLPNLLLGLIARLAGWPYGTAYVLILFQGLLSIATALVLFLVLGRIQRHTSVNALLSIVFLLSTDLIVMEYNNLGQTFYENVPMVLMPLTAACYLQLVRTNRPRSALLLGLMSATLALCRASYAYFFVVPLVFIVLRKRSRTWRHLSAFALCILLLHGGWSAKNYLVYGYATLSTSSWTGLNCAVGLDRAGMQAVFLDSMFRDEQQYPAWFIRMLRQEGFVRWHLPVFEAYVPQDVQQHEAQVQRILYNTNRSENSIGQRLVADLYLHAWVRFAMHHPGLMLQKFTASYIVFWQPIRNFSAMYFGPIFVTPKVTNSFDLPQVWQAYFTTDVHEQHYFLRGTIYTKQARPIAIYALPYLPILVLLVNLVVLHSIVPGLIVGDLVRRLMGKPGILPTEFYFLVSCYVYAALIMNISDHGENMRFRLSIEPIIWIIAMAALTHLAAVVGSLPRIARKETTP